MKLITNFVEGEATRKSQARAMLNPPPAAAPFTMAITGLVQKVMARVILPT